MGKYIGFIICLIFGFGLLTLSLIQDTITCNRDTAQCTFISKIRYVNIELNRELFSVYDLDNAYCQKQVQPSRRGKQSYYTLKADINNKPYTITTYKKLSQCRAGASEIKKYIKNSTQNNLYINSGMGFINTFGIMFAFLIIFIGIIILCEKPEISDESD